MDIAPSASVLTTLLGFLDMSSEVVLEMSALTWVCDLSALPLSAVLKPVTCAWVCVCEVLALPANPGTVGDCAVPPKSPVKRIAPGAELVATGIDCKAVSAHDNES